MLFLLLHHLVRLLSLQIACEIIFQLFVIGSQIECVEMEKSIFFYVSKQTDFITLLFSKVYMNFGAKLRYTFAVICYRCALTSFV